MCAIAGMISLAVASDTQARMLKTMSKRGPDASNVWKQDDATLLHCRLAIIDPAGGKQPMELSFNGEQYVLVYNGELYNTQELRGELEKAGHEFKDHSDT